MATATKEKKPREKLSTRDGVDLYIALEQAVEDNIDEIELNGGALPDWMAAMFDEVQAAIADRVDAFKFKIDEFSGKAFAAKAVKDGAARRETVWNNVIKSMKAYGLHQVQRTGAGRLEGHVHVMRTQVNGQPSTELTAPPETHQALLIGLYDAEQIRAQRQVDAEQMAGDFDIAVDATGIDVPDAHPLAKYITVQRVAMIDKKALGAAYLARREQLIADTPLLDEPDIPQDVRDRFGLDDLQRPDDELNVTKHDALEYIRQTYIADNLALEFPGVRCERGVHLRID